MYRTIYEKTCFKFSILTAFQFFNHKIIWIFYQYCVKDNKSIDYDNMFGKYYGDYGDLEMLIITNYY